MYAENENVSKLLIIFHHIKLRCKRGLGENKTMSDQRMLLILHEYHREEGPLVQFQHKSAGWEILKRHKGPSHFFF